jgi:tetratricopeptide (TPR) repeat protein
MAEYAECLVVLSHPQKAIEGLKKELLVATGIELSNHALMSHAFYTLGLAYLKVKNIVSAFHFINRALMEHALEDEQDPIFMARLYKSLADCIKPVSLREYEQYLNQALEQYGAFDGEEVAGLYLEIAHNHANKMDYTSSIAYTNRAISAYLRKGMVDECKDCEHLLVMCKYRQHPSDYEKFIDRLLKIATHFKDREAERRAGLFLDIATIFYEVKKNHTDKALQYVMEAKALIGNDHPLTGKALMLLGFIYIDHHETSEAKRHLHKAIDILTRTDCLHELQQTVDALIDLLEKEGVYKEGLDVSRSFNGYLTQRLQAVSGVSV